MKKLLLFYLLLQAISGWCQKDNIIKKIDCQDVPYNEEDVALSTKYVETFNCFKTPIFFKMIKGPYGGGYSDANMEGLQLHLFTLEGQRAISKLPDRLFPAYDNACYLITAPVPSFADFNIECKQNGQKKNVELKVNKMSNEGVYEIEAKSVITGEYIIFLIWKPVFEGEIKPSTPPPSNKSNSRPSMGTWPLPDYSFVRTINDRDGFEIATEFKANRKCEITTGSYLSSTKYTRIYNAGETFQIRKETIIVGSRSLD